MNRNHCNYCSPPQHFATVAFFANKFILLFWLNAPSEKKSKKVHTYESSSMIFKPEVNSWNFSRQHLLNCLRGTHIKIIIKCIITCNYEQLPILSPKKTNDTCSSVVSWLNPPIKSFRNCGGPSPLRFAPMTPFANLGRYPGCMNGDIGKWYCW